MKFINQVTDKYKLVADIIDLKPRLKEKKLLDKEEHLAPKFEEATLRVSTSNTFAYEYELTVNVPVPAAYIRDKKKDNMGNFVQQLHSLIDNKIGKWMGTPSIGGHTGRARKGMLSLDAKWYFNDAMFAYALGLDLTESFGSATVVDKTQITTRMHKAEKAAKDMTAYKENAQKKLKLRSQDKDERNQIWKDEFMQGFVDMSSRYEKEGMSFSKLMTSERKSRYAHGASEVPENFSERMDKALDVLKKDKKLEAIMLDLTQVNTEFRRGMSDKQALDLEKKEMELVKKAEDRENELGVKKFNGFPYI